MAPVGWAKDNEQWLWYCNCQNTGGPFPTKHEAQQDANHHRRQNISTLFPHNPEVYS